MELLDRYLDAVKRYLPKDQQDDILAELSDDIQSQVESKETQLGRPLTLDEQSDILKQYDRPILAASRYNRYQYLIGPVLFPYYVNTLKIAVLIVLALWIAGTAIQALTITGDRGGTIFAAWPSLWSSLLWVVGVVTIFFAVRERVPNVSSKSWDPRKLAPVREGKPIARSQTISEMLFSLVFLFWILDVPGVRYTVWHMMAGSATSIPLQGAQAWQQFLSALVIVAVVTIAVDCVNLVRPDWSQLRAAMLVATNAFMVIVLAFVLQSHTFFVLPAMQSQETAAALNITVYYTLIVWAIIAGVVAVFNLRALWLDIRRARSGVTLSLSKGD